MRDDQIAAALREANPWWVAAAMGRSPTAWTTSHRLFRERRRNDLGYRSDVLSDVAVEPVDDRLIVLTGPRRIGKSVALLDVAADLCGRDDIDPRQVIHVPADEMSAQDLHRVFALGREHTSSVDVPSPRPRVWLLDEVSSISGWTTTLKRTRDQTSVGDDTVIATGSRWAAGDDITANLLADRAGRGSHRRIRHLLPMTFREFVTATKRELPGIGPVPLWDLQSDAARAQLEEVRFLVDDYDLAWQAYLRCGGFPRAVYEHYHDGLVSEGYLKDLEAWLIADLETDESPDSVSLLLDGLLTRATSPFNATKTAESLGYSNRKQLERRMTRLVATFAALECPQRDERGQAVRGAQSKYYLTDPVLAWLPSRLRSGLGEPETTTLTEMALGVSMAAAIEDLEPGRWTVRDTIGYARTDAGKEVDLAPVQVRTPAGVGSTTPVEGKWVANGWRSEAKTVENKYHAGILATRNVLDMRNPSWAVPAPLVAMLLR